MTDNNSNKITEEAEFDWDALNLRLEKYKVLDRQIYDEELPSSDNFDVYASISDSLLAFGISKDFSKSGWAVRYIGNIKITYPDGNIVDMSNTVGYIVAESNGRILMQTGIGYFGWLNPEDYVLINYVDNTSGTLH